MRPRGRRHPLWLFLHTSILRLPKNALLNSPINAGLDVLGFRPAFASLRVSASLRETTCAKRTIQSLKVNLAKFARSLTSFPFNTIGYFRLGRIVGCDSEFINQSVPALIRTNARSTDLRSCVGRLSWSNQGYENY